MRQVKVFTSDIGNGKIIETDATTFGGLKNAFEANDISFNNNTMKAIVGETRNTLESSDAILPEGFFKVFLMPRKTKSGNDECCTENPIFTQKDKEILRIVANVVAKNSYTLDIDDNEERILVEYANPRINRENVADEFASVLDDPDL